jgi:hypothetical protein
VKLLKLFAASALIDGRPTVDDGDFFVLRTSGTASIRFRSSTTSWGRCSSGIARDHPEARVRRTSARDLDGILAELGVIRSLLLGGEPLSDVQLFSQLRNLQEIRAACRRSGPTPRRTMAGRSTSCSKACSSRPSGAVETSRWEPSKGSQTLPRWYARQSPRLPTRSRAAERPPRRPQRRAFSTLGGPVELGGEAEAARTLGRLYEVERSLERALTHGFHSYAGRMHPSIARGAVAAFSATGDARRRSVLRQRHRAGGGDGAGPPGVWRRRQPAGRRDRAGADRRCWARRGASGW